ncbi:hypothetical protein BDR05DRAFT_574422 [Suillus weaverae]|nr:hypothetical protein BDR05DRAFT_574422 [Suillus weaverae]
MVRIRRALIGYFIGFKTLKTAITRDRRVSSTTSRSSMRATFSVASIRLKIMLISSCSTGDTQFSYTSMFTAVFINQAFWNTLRGFEPNTTSPDPDWGQCLQCAAIDRAVSLRSKFYSQCFVQDCYNPSNLPSNSELPGRQFAFVNPDLGGL